MSNSVTNQLSTDAGSNLTPANLATLERELAAFSRERLTRSSPFGYWPVAASYNIGIRTSATRTKIIVVDDQKYFVINKYCCSDINRLYYNFLKWLFGCAERKPLGASWKRLCESRSRLPVISHSRPDMFVTPFVDSVNARDLFANRSSLIVNGGLDWIHGLTRHDLLVLIRATATALAAIHAQGLAWGEAIINNVIITAERQPIFVDPENTFVSATLIERQAADLFSLISSTIGAGRDSRDGIDDDDVIEAVLSGYGSRAAAIDAAIERLTTWQPAWWQRWILTILGKKRVQHELSVMRRKLAAALGDVANRNICTA